MGNVATRFWKGRWMPNQGSALHSDTHTTILFVCLKKEDFLWDLYEVCGMQLRKTFRMSCSLRVAFCSVQASMLFWLFWLTILCRHSTNIWQPTDRRQTPQWQMKAHLSVSTIFCFNYRTKRVKAQGTLSWWSTVVHPNCMRTAGSSICFVRAAVSVY